MKKSVAIFTLALLSVAGIFSVTLRIAAQGATGNKVASSSQINPENIRAHVKFLASDLLEGRGTGQRGGDIAAEYIAAQFALDGLQPAGDNGTYFQDVPMVGVKTLPETTFKLAPANGESLTLKNFDESGTNNENQTEQPEN